MNLEKKDIGKNVLVLNPLGKGYLKIYFDSREGWVPEGSITMVPLAEFKGELTSKQAEYILEPTPDKSYLLSFRPGSQNYFFTVKNEKREFKHIQITREKGGDLLYALENNFVSINALIRDLPFTLNFKNLFPNKDTKQRKQPLAENQTRAKKN